MVCIEDRDTRIDAYAQGWEARRESKTQGDNPFDQDTDEERFDDWDDGWFNADAFLREFGEVR
jgi:U3 small nucleolar RNA-associated protein 14